MRVIHESGGVSVIADRFGHDIFSDTLPLAIAIPNRIPTEALLAIVADREPGTWLSIQAKDLLEKHLWREGMKRREVASTTTDTKQEAE